MNLRDRERAFRPDARVIRQKTVAMGDYESVQEAFAAGVLDDLDSDEAIIVIGKWGSVFELNIVAALLWDMINVSPETAAALAKKISDIFDIELRQAEKDVESVVADWCSKGLIEIA